MNMAEMVTVVISDAETVWDDPQAAKYIEFKMDMNDTMERQQILDIVEFFSNKGLHVYTSYEDGVTLNVSRAFHDMKEFEKRHPDV